MPICLKSVLTNFSVELSLLASKLLVHMLVDTQVNFYQTMSNFFNWLFDLASSKILKRSRFLFNSTSLFKQSGDFDYVCESCGTLLSECHDFCKQSQSLSTTHPVDILKSLNKFSQIIKLTKRLYLECLLVMFSTRIYICYFQQQEVPDTQDLAVTAVHINGQRDASTT